MRSAERQAAAQSAQIGIAQAQLYPIVSVTGTISWQASRFKDLFNSQAMAGSVGPSFQWNILNYGRLINGVRVQDAVFRELVANYQNTVLKAESEVENSITGYLKGHQVVKALAKGVVASDKGARVGTIQFREGKINFVTLALLQQNLLTQQDQLATAYGALVQSLIQTYQAIGGGWQIRLQKQGEVLEEAAPPAPNMVPDVDPKDLTLLPEAGGNKSPGRARSCRVPALTSKMSTKEYCPMKLSLLCGALLLAISAPASHADPLLFGRGLFSPSCAPACNTCPDDYVSKALPCVPARTACGTADDYCRKPFPCVRCTVNGTGADDYCAKPLPRCLPPSTRPWYSCGPTQDACAACSKK